MDEDQQADILQLKKKIVLKRTQSDIRVVPQMQGSNRDDYLGLLAKIGIIPKLPMPNFASLRRIVKAYNCSPFLIDYWGTLCYNICKIYPPKRGETMAIQYIMRYRNCSVVVLAYMRD